VRSENTRIHITTLRSEVISIDIDIMGDLWKLYHKLRWKLKVLDYLNHS